MINKGTYRTVWIIGNYAIKLPRLKFDCNILLRIINGYLCNTSEYDTYKIYKDEIDDQLYRICPVIWNFFGFIVVMRKTTPLTNEEFDRIKSNKHSKSKFQSIPNDPLGRKIIWDIKKENFGVLDGDIVIVDYADDFRGKFRSDNVFNFK